MTVPERKSVDTRFPRCQSLPVISSKAIIAAGLDSASLKARFDTPTPGIPEKRLIDRWRARAQQGRDSNLENYKLYAAIDAAWDAGFRQTTQTLIGLIRDLSESSGENSTAAMDTARKWGMTHLIVDEKDPKTGKPTGKKVLSLPVMNGVILSLPRAFTLMRVARIVTERLQVPLMRFDPAYMTDDNRLNCEIATQRVETGNREFGYSELFSEAVQAAAMYGQQLMLVAEEWYTENDVLDGVGEAPVDPATGMPAIDPTTGAPVPPPVVSQLKVGKEGLRYVLPHPSRSYADIDWPLWTFNHDCGVSYVGYWRVTKFGSIRGNTAYWNRDRITRATIFSDPRWLSYFQTTGNRQMAVPYSTNWFSTTDREQQLDRATSFYSASQDDQPVWVTEHFEKINPRVDFDDPKMPDAEIWFRIVLASDDVPIYMAALPDRPGCAWMYEPIGNRSIQTSLMMELLPYGDHGTNLITQAIIAAEQNLANITFFDRDVLDPVEMRGVIENPGRKFYRKLVMKDFSGRKLLRQQADIKSVFQSFRFPQLDISEHLTLLAQLISLMKQSVGMSEQETGSTASHEQSAEEIKVVHTATGHRAEYIASWVDFSFEAWKRQLFTFYTQYSTIDAYAFLGGDNADRVVKMGYQIEQTNEDGRILVRAPLGRMRVEHFAAQRDGPNRIPWVSIGGQMLAFLNGIMSSPLAQVLPPQHLVDLINEGLESLQFPRSFRLRLPQTPEMGVPEVMQQYIQEQLAGLANQVKVFVSQQIQEAQTEEPKKK